MKPALLLYNHPVCMKILFVSILPTITTVWYKFSSLPDGVMDGNEGIWVRDVLIMCFLVCASIVSFALIIPYCSFFCDKKYEEVSDWIERDLFTLFIEKRPLREIDLTTQNAIWDEIARQLNLKIEKGLGICNFYSKDSLISELDNKIDKTSESLKGVASRDILGRDKLIILARRVKGKDIESTFPQEIIELENKLNVESDEEKKKM